MVLGTVSVLLYGAQVLLPHDLHLSDHVVVRRVRVRVRRFIVYVLFHFLQVLLLDLLIEKVLQLGPN